jgi:DNA replication protein DnaC
MSRGSWPLAGECPGESGLARGFSPYRDARERVAIAALDASGFDFEFIAPGGSRRRGPLEIHWNEPFEACAPVRQFSTARRGNKTCFAGFRWAAATVESFDFSASPKLPAAQIRDLAALRWLQAGESIILYGAVGVGKTHVAQAMGHLAIRAGAEVRFHKTSRILADLAGGHADHTFDKRLAAHVKADLLILDDFAMREFTPTQADDLYVLVSQRVAEGRSIAITANRAPQDCYALFPNPVVAESLLDRLVNTSHQVFMNGPSYRPNKRPKNPSAKTEPSAVK